MATDTNPEVVSGDATAAQAGQQEHQGQWDKDKQRADQAEANLRKILEEKEDLDGRLNAQAEKVAALEKRLQQQADKVDIEDLDPNVADIPDVVRVNKKLIDELKASKEKLAKLETAEAEFRAMMAEQQAEKTKQQRIEKILKPLDEEFGAKYRNAAYKLANEAVAKGEPAPSDHIDGYLFMRKFYKQAIDAEKKSTESAEESVSLDTGGGGFFYGGSDVKEGSLNEVVADVKKKWRIV